MITLNLEGKSPLGSDQLEAIASAIEKTLSIEKNISVGVSFVDKETIRRLNEKYAGNDYPTDVLSFEYGESDNDSNVGDVAICTEIAQKQAKDNGLSGDAELSLLLAHGILHILGYDHQDSEQAASLDAIQSDIMKKLNYEYRDFKWSH